MDHRNFEVIWTYSVCFIIFVDSLVVSGCEKPVMVQY